MNVVNLVNFLEGRYRHPDPANMADKSTAAGGVAFTCKVHYVHHVHRDEPLFRTVQTKGEESRMRLNRILTRAILLFQHRIVVKNVMSLVRVGNICTTKTLPPQFCP